MRIAILSDTHGRTERVRQALAQLGARAELIIHCGDIDDAATVRLFPAGTHFVYGNCDSDRDELREAMAEIGAIVHEPFGSLELAGKTLAFLHGDDDQLLRSLVESDAFDFVFHGHTHVAKDERVGRTRVINPGALHRAAVKTFLLLELPSGETETVRVE